MVTHVPGIPHNYPLDNQPLACNNTVTGSEADNASNCGLGNRNNNPPRSTNDLPSIIHTHTHVHLDKVKLFQIWRETDSRLDVLHARVREGVDVMAASEFCRWLRFSGILSVLESVEQPEPLPVHGRDLRVKVERLIADCGDWFGRHEHANTKPHPQVPRSELERINAQLLELTQAVAKLTSPHAAESPHPDLRIIPGGIQT